MIMNVANINKFREEFKKTVAELEAKHNIVIDLGKIGFDEESFKAKITVLNVKEGQDASRGDLIEAENEWKRCAEVCGLPVEKLGVIFKKKGVTYKVLGLISRRRAHPVLIMNLTSNKEQLFTLEGAIDLLK